MNRLPNISLPGSYMSCFVLKASEEKRDPNRGTFLSCRSLAHFAPPVREEKLRKTPRDMIQSLETLRLQSTSPIGTYRVASPTRSILSYSEHGISWSESMLNDFTLEINVLAVYASRRALELMPNWTSHFGRVRWVLEPRKDG